MKSTKPLIIPTEPELSVADIANHYKVGEATVLRWTRYGMPTTKYNSRLIRYRLSEVEAWLKARAAKLAEATK